MLQKILQSILKHIFYDQWIFLEKSCCLSDTIEINGTAGRATYDNIIRRIRFACWITKATDTHWELQCLLLFHGKNGYGNVPQYGVICTLPVFVDATCGNRHFIHSLAVSTAEKLIKPLLQYELLFRVVHVFQNSMQRFLMSRNCSRRIKIQEYYSIGKCVFIYRRPV